jgi:putative ATP-dependent endonuclease of OLD family
VRISRIRIVNFANFADLDLETSGEIVGVGENKVGKSNLVRALQLILDPGLSERDRHLGFEHFWDGLGDKKLGAVVEISIELTDFEDNPQLLAHLADFLIDPGPPMVARLTYRFQPKSDLGRKPQNLADYEYVIFGGDDPRRTVAPSLRWMLPLDVQAALRDAEKDLANWRRSPLRPVIEALISKLDQDSRDEMEAQVNALQDGVSSHEAVQSAAESIARRLLEMTGAKHAVPISLGLAPTRLDALLRGLRIMIDDGARGLDGASLGTANLVFLALKSIELDRMIAAGERDHTFFAVEEPEAHLHPHVQRLVYRHFFERGGTALTTILTTHSPHIVSVAPLRSIVLLRRDPLVGATVGRSTASIDLSDREVDDLQRYIDVNRGELFFARGVILVEGDAERFLVPAFAEELQIRLDVLGISVCSVSGTNFAPYVKLLGPDGLNIPHVVLTDLDPVADVPERPRVRSRLVRLLELRNSRSRNFREMPLETLIERAAKRGYFVNGSTLETELFVGGLAESMRDVLLDELTLSEKKRATLQSWVDEPAQVDGDELIALIERVGKGRFAQALAPYVSEFDCPDYIQRALEHIRDAIA